VLTTSEVGENKGKLMRDGAVSCLNIRKSRSPGSGTDSNATPKPTFYERLSDDNEKDRELRSQQ
jgi:hypothetical protein